ncbi:MAG: hypothetical protein ACREOG_20320 [Gemmatimonadaceae bacterium]
MIRQPHKNLFFSYRGFRPRRGAQQAIDRQLEDNATKALLYVLEGSSRAQVLAPFLRQIVGVGPPSDIDTVQFALQRVDIARPKMLTRIALGIAPISRIDPHRQTSHLSGRPDAWIWAEERFAILIETKVRGAVSRHQLRRHIRGAEGWSVANTREVPQSWGTIYDFFSRLRRTNQKLDSTTRLLLDEFVRYLRMMALASDTTFDIEDFGYFLLRTEDRDAATRALLSRKLVRFTEDLTRTRSIKRIVMRYSTRSNDVEKVVNRGVFRRDSTNHWITIGPKDRLDRSHFTVRLGEDGISLEVFSPHQSFTRQLVAKIERDPRAFVASLRAISPSEPFVTRLRSDALLRAGVSSLSPSRVRQRRPGTAAGISSAGRRYQQHRVRGHRRPPGQVRHSSHDGRRNWRGV